MPAWLIKIGLAAILFSSMSLSLVFARMKIAKLTHENNVLKEQDIHEEAEKKLADEQRVREAIDAEIQRLRKQAQAASSEMAAIVKVSQEKESQIKGAASWTDITIK
jgi:hypothetical protein